MPDFQINSAGQEVGRVFNIAGTFTPAATSHLALDCVGGAVSFHVHNARGRMVRLLGYRFNMATTTPVTTVWTAYLYSSTPSVVADDSPYVVVSGDGAIFLGTVSIAQVVDFGSTWLESQGALSQPPIQLGSSSSITVYLQNVSTVTLEAVAHQLILTLEILP